MRQENISVHAIYDFINDVKQKFFFKLKNVLKIIPLYNFTPCFLFKNISAFN